jgi:hypothetical protein
MRRTRPVPSLIPPAGLDLAGHARCLVKPELPTHASSLRTVEKHLVTDLDDVHRHCNRGIRVVEDPR